MPICDQISFWFARNRYIFRRHLQKVFREALINNLFRSGVRPGNTHRLAGSPMQNLNSTHTIANPSKLQAIKLMASITAKLDLYKVDAVFHGDTVVHTSGGQPITPLESTWKRMGIVGAGGFGVVWRETAEDSKQLRAVKVIPRKEVNIREVKALVEVQDVRTLQLSISQANWRLASKAFHPISVLVRRS